MLHLASTVFLCSRCLHLRQHEEKIKKVSCQELPRSAEIDDESDNEFCLEYSL